MHMQLKCRPDSLKDHVTQRVESSLPRAAGVSVLLPLVENEMTSNKCDSPGDELGSAAASKDVKRFLKGETVRKMKSVAGHVGLLIALMLYTVVGALVSPDAKFDRIPIT